MEYRTVGTLNSEITVYWTLSFIVNKHRGYPLKCLVGKWGYSVKCLSLILSNEERKIKGIAH